MPTTSTSPRIPAAATHDELVERARALVPALRERAPAGEQLRTLPPETLDDLAATGIHRCLTPERWGGYEHPWRTMAATTAELARGCASAAWCTMFVAAHDWLVCHYDEEAQAEFFADGPDARAAGVFAPTGRARRVDGGYRVSGEWAWASGIPHCDWLIGGAFVEGEAPPHLRFFLFDATQFSWRDTWFNAGLRATGSHTGVVEDAFVPAHRVIGIEAASEGVGPGVESNPNPLYRTPFPAPFGALCAMVTLGTVRGAYEQFVEWTKTRASGTTGLGVAGRTPVQIALARTAAQIDAAELLLDRVIARASDPDALDYRRRVTCRRDTCYATELLIDAIDCLQRLGAARGLLESNPLQRAWRDAHAIAGHILFNFDGTGERFGRLELDLEPPPPQHDPYF